MPQHISGVLTTMGYKEMTTERLGQMRFNAEKPIECFHYNQIQDAVKDMNSRAFYATLPCTVVCLTPSTGPISLLHRDDAKFMAKDLDMDRVKRKYYQHIEKNQDDSEDDVDSRRMLYWAIASGTVKCWDSNNSEAKKSPSMRRVVLMSDGDRQAHSILFTEHLDEFSAALGPLVVISKPRRYNDDVAQRSLEVFHSRAVQIADIMAKCGLERILFGEASDEEEERVVHRKSRKITARKVKARKPRAPTKRSKKIAKKDDDSYGDDDNNKKTKRSSDDSDDDDRSMDTSGDEFKTVATERPQRQQHKKKIKLSVEPTPPIVIDDDDDSEKSTNSPMAEEDAPLKTTTLVEVAEQRRDQEAETDKSAVQPLSTEQQAQTATEPLTTSPSVEVAPKSAPISTTPRLASSPLPLKPGQVTFSMLDDFLNSVPFGKSLVV
jgi:hypothetical protein